MRKIAFLCPYFGTFPKHIQLWLNSCAANLNATFFVFTDDRQELSYPENVKVEYMTIEELKNRFQKKFDFPISLSGAYKLGDYKPAYGYLFEELIEGYDAWGHIDVPDEIYGDIFKFLTDEVIDNNDKLMLLGHMTIYRNDKGVNKRFMEKSNASFNYRDIFLSSKFYNFEELACGSINHIYVYNNWKIGRMEEVIADLSGLYYSFRRGCWTEDFKLYYPSKAPSIYVYDNGKVYGYFLDNGNLICKEYLYVHFKRRKMELNVPLSADRYLITPKGFEPYENITVDLVRKKGKGKLLYDVYFKEKKKALLTRLKKFCKN